MYDGAMNRLVVVALLAAVGCKNAPSEDQCKQLLEHLVDLEFKKAGAAAPSAQTPAARKLTPTDAAAVAGIEKKLTSHLGARVALQHTPKKGKIVIAYAGNDDLQRILEKLAVEA